MGAEIETGELGGGMALSILNLPDLFAMQELTHFMGTKYIKNINLSSQNAHMTLRQLIDVADSFEALYVPAHIFTPHKSLYGSAAKRMADVLGNKASHAAGVELGLSADTLMADRIFELTEFTFLSNSDAHSLDKIAREYNLMLMAEADYQGLKN